MIWLFAILYYYHYNTIGCFKIQLSDFKSLALKRNGKKLQYNHQLIASAAPEQH